MAIAIQNLLKNSVRFGHFQFWEVANLKNLFGFQ